MPFERHVLRSAALAAALLASYPAMAANDLQGVWMNDTGRGAIEIKPCTGSDKLCGHVVWVKDTTDVKGCGRQIIGDAVSVGGGVWDNGWIYSPEKKKNYDVELTPLSDGTLQVKGYAGIKFLSKTMIWTKAPSDLVRCSTEQAAAQTAPKGEAGPAPEETQQKAEPAEKAAPEPEEQQDVAENEKKGIDLEGMAGEFGDVFTMKDGKCKVDTPWVKLDIDCKKKDEEPGEK